MCEHKFIHTYIHSFYLHPTVNSRTFKPTFVSVEVNLYGGVSTGVEDLSGVDLENGHGAGP